jgi:hypothetical protein
VAASNLYRWDAEQKAKGTYNHHPNRRRNGKVRGADWPELEQKLNDTVQAWFSNLLPVQREDIQDEMMRLVEQHRQTCISLTGKQIERLNAFKASNKWLDGFMKRYHLSLRAVTSLSSAHTRHLHPDNQQQTLDQCVDYLAQVASLCYQHGYSQDHIYNLDETSLAWDMPPKRTVAARGARVVPLATTGSERKYFSVILGASMSGTHKLPVGMVFKRTVTPSGESLVAKDGDRDDDDDQEEQRVWMNASGSWNSQTFIEYMEVALQSTPQGRKLFILDAASVHKSALTREWCGRHGVDVVLIPAGMTAKLQPMDLAVMKDFKLKVRREWKSYMHRAARHAGMHRDQAPAKRRAAPASLREWVEWVQRSWQQVKKEAIHGGFRKALLVEVVK